MTKDLNSQSIGYPKTYFAVSCYYGIPTLLPITIETNLFDTLSSDQEKRARSALRERLSVIPRAKGMYWVFSYSDDEIKRYSVDLDTTSCTCSDFMYNCEPDTGLVCKHIWRIRFLIYADALPSVKQNPYNWMLFQLEKDRQYLKQTNYTEQFEQIKTLQESLIQDQSWNVEYKRVFRRRSDILSTLPSVSISLPNTSLDSLTVK